MTEYRAAGGNRTYCGKLTFWPNICNLLAGTNYFSQQCPSWNGTYGKPVRFNHVKHQKCEEHLLYSNRYLIGTSFISAF